MATSTPTKPLYIKSLPPFNQLVVTDVDGVLLPGQVETCLSVVDEYPRLTVVFDVFNGDVQWDDGKDKAPGLAAAISAFSMLSPENKARFVKAMEPWL
jgi:hypothetical protein